MFIDIFQFLALILLFYYENNDGVVPSYTNTKAQEKQTRRSVIVTLLSLLQDNSKGPGTKRATTTTTTANNTTNANKARIMLSGIKRSNSDEQATVKKRLKTNHVSPNVSHPNFRSQLVGNKSTKPVMGETVMVFDPKSRNLVYKEGPVRQNDLKIADVRSIKTLKVVTPKDPLAVRPPAKASKNPVTLPRLSEVAIIPLKSPQTSLINYQKTPSSPSTSTAPSTSAQNGYTSTPDISIRSVPRITSPVPGSSRTSSMSSPGAASSTSTITTTNMTDVPKKDEKPPPSVNREMNQPFKDLLEVCKASDQSKDMNLITTKLVKYYQRVHPDFVNSLSFIRCVEKATADIKSQPAQVFWLLRTIVEELQIRQGGTSIADDGEIVTENNEAVTTGDPRIDKKLYKLNKCLYITQKKIEKLREQDAMWEEENNSSYLMISRFEKRAVKIYEKICELTGESTDANRRVKKPIKFNKTKYTEFNKSLQSWYNKTLKFPDFYDVLKVLEYCNSQYDYGLKGDGLKVVGE